MGEGCLGWGLSSRACRGISCGVPQAGHGGGAQQGKIGKLHHGERRGRAEDPDGFENPDDPSVDSVLSVVKILGIDSSRHSRSSGSTVFPVPWLGRLRGAGRTCKYEDSCVRGLPGAEASFE